MNDEKMGTEAWRKAEAYDRFFVSQAEAAPAADGGQGGAPVATRKPGPWLIYETVAEARPFTLYRQMDARSPWSRNENMCGPDGRKITFETREQAEVAAKAANQSAVSAGQSSLRTLIDEKEEAMSQLRILYRSAYLSRPDAEAVWHGCSALAEVLVRLRLQVLEMEKS